MRLGQGSKRLDLAARAIETNFDVVAVEEVMSFAGLEALVRELPGWRAALSDHSVGENG